MPFMCEKCGDEFTDHDQYLEHRTGHITGRIPVKTIEELRGEPGPEAHEPEIIEAPALGVPGPTATEQQFKPWSKEPIRLTYQYNGSCPKCSRPVKTIVLDKVMPRSKKIVVVAWCEAHGQQEQAVVPELEEVSDDAIDEKRQENKKVHDETVRQEKGQESILREHKQRHYNRSGKKAIE